MITSFLASTIVLATTLNAANWFGPNALNKDGNVQASCHMTPAYPPPANRTLPEYTIDLDAPASERWKQPTLDFKRGIQRVVDLTIGSKYMFPFRALVDKVGINTLLSRVPQDWSDEIVSIASLIERSVTNVFLYNLAYALMGFCTSIVAQDDANNVYHGRNVDFGLWPAVNWSDCQWDLTTELKEILFTVNFTRNGALLYRSATYGGFIGFHTGVKAGAFSLSIDIRFDSNIDKYLMKWMIDSKDSDELLVLTTRYVMENIDSYCDAVQYFSGVSMASPGYIILGGIDEGEAVVLTIGAHKTLFDEWIMSLPQNDTEQAPFYVLETNYDHWNEPPKYDDRRYPAEQCMKQIGSNHINEASLYNVLNAVPNRNRLTTFTALMRAQTGHLEAYKQYCDDKECSPW